MRSRREEEHTEFRELRKIVYKGSDVRETMIAGIHADIMMT